MFGDGVGAAAGPAARVMRSNGGIHGARAPAASLRESACLKIPT